MKIVNKEMITAKNSGQRYRNDIRYPLIFGYYMDCFDLFNYADTVHVVWCSFHFYIVWQISDNGADIPGTSSICP